MKLETASEGCPLTQAMRIVARLAQVECEYTVTADFEESPTITMNDATG